YNINLFFFSSRRRHTRFSRDWSSDVCSSDLLCMVTTFPAPMLAANSEGLTGTELLALCNSTYDTDYGFCAGYITGIANALLAGRSEERRVGKECGERWLPK